MTKDKLQREFEEAAVKLIKQRTVHTRKAVLACQGPAPQSKRVTGPAIGEILKHASFTDDAGFDTILLAEAYTWWRKH